MTIDTDFRLRQRNKIYAQSSNKLLGVTLKCFVKQRVKYFGSLNPTSYAISEIFIVRVTLFFSRSSRARFKR